MITWSKVNSYVGNHGSPALSFYRSCPICGSLREKVVMELNDFQFFTDSVQLPKIMSIRETQCLACFALYRNPCYSEYGFSVLLAEAGRSYGSAEARANEQVQWLSSRNLLTPGSRVLDAGCYEGQFLSRLSDDVHKVGVDIDGPAIERGRKRFGGQGIDLVQGDFETFHYAGAPDMITMFHVLEHLPRPLSVLRNLRRIAHRATRLVLEVPILENGKTDDINGFFSTQHLTHFSRSSLRNCVSRSGWRITEWCEQPDYNGCRVLAEVCEEAPVLTPAFQDTQSLYEYLSSWFLALAAVEKRLNELKNIRRCVIWGGGAHTEVLYHTTTFHTCNPDREYAIVDSDPMKQGNTWRGIMIHSPSVLTEVEWPETWLVVSSYGSQEAILQAAIELGVPTNRIARLYDEERVY